MSKDWKWISPPVQSFAGLPVITNLENLEADIAILGRHYTSPYSQLNPSQPVQNRVQTAPAAIRRQSSIFTNHLNHYSFDFNDTLLADRNIQIVDCGDVDKQVSGGVQQPEHITTAIRTLLDKGAVPIAIGTDEGSAIFALRAYHGYQSLCVVHVDAHIDWRDERDGVRDCYSSVMRRASEMPWVQFMAQVGLRGIGSARQKEVDDAHSFGSILIRARDVHKQGIDTCLERIPPADHYIITIDADALDTAIAPGVLFPSPGGLTFDETTDLIKGISSKGRIVGMNLFEVRPERDVNDITAATGAQSIINFIGVLAHSGQLGK